MFNEPIGTSSAQRPPPKQYFITIDAHVLAVISYQVLYRHMLQVRHRLITLYILIFVWYATLPLEVKTT